MENDDIDDDIERLQIVLQNEEPVVSEGSEAVEEDEDYEELIFKGEGSTSFISRPSTSTDVTAETYADTETTGLGDGRASLTYRLGSSQCNLDTVLTMNHAYQEMLLDILRQTELALEENRSMQKQLDQDMSDEMETKEKKKSHSRSLISYTIPYFKDKSDRAPPKNDDVLIKQMLHEPKQHIKPPLRWTKQLTKVLKMAVQQDALEQLLRPFQCRLELEHEKLAACKSMEQTTACKERIAKIEQDMEEKKRTPAENLLAEVNIDRVDWMKISVIQFPGRYDAQACRQMWKNVMSPLVNCGKWLKEEEDQLFTLVEEHKMRNWKEIAEKLGNRRSPFQCLQYFQQRSFVFDESPWTPEEDDLLKEVVDTCKVGIDTVYWNQVAYYIEGRSGTQCQKRWQSICPMMKRGRWGKQEDCLLLAAVQLLGSENWGRVKSLVPGRTSAQCRDRWMHSLSPGVQPKQWTYEQDKIMLTAVEKYGIGSWRKIRKEVMPQKTDNQLLVRYRRLMDWKAMMDTFTKLPRSVQKSLMSQLNQRLKYGKMKNFKPKARNDSLGMSIIGGALSDLKKDYLKQERDRRNGDIVVPRPPPTVKYSVRSFHSTWTRRENLRKLIETQVNKTMKKISVESLPKDVANTAVSNLDPIINEVGVTSRRDLVNMAFEGKRPSEISVREILQISNVLSEMKGKSDKPRMAPPAKQPRTLISRKKHVKISQQLRTLIEGKIGAVEVKPLVLPFKDMRKYDPWSRFLQQVESSPEDVEKTKKKALDVLLKSFEVDTDFVSKKAFLRTEKRKQGKEVVERDMFVRKSKRRSLRIAADTQPNDECQDLLELYPPSNWSSKYGGIQAVPAQSTSSSLTVRDTPEVSTFAPAVGLTVPFLDRKPKLSVEDKQMSDTQTVEVKGSQSGTADCNTMETSVISLTKQSTVIENFPVLPPNGTNLCALHALLLQRRLLMKKADGWGKAVMETKQYHKQATKSDRQRSSAIALEKVIDKADLDGKDVQTPQQQTDTDQRDEKKMSYLKDIRDSQHYKDLLKRFQSIFSWPALMATVQVPEPLKSTPSQTQTSAEVVLEDDCNMPQEIETQSQSTSNMSDISSHDDSLDNIPSVSPVSKLEENQCGEAVETPEVETETGSVVDQVVSNILDVFKEQKEERKRRRKTRTPMMSSSRKRKMNITSKEWREQIMRKRERTKLLNRLGLKSFVDEEKEKEKASLATDSIKKEHVDQGNKCSKTYQPIVLSGTTTDTPKKRGRGRPAGGKNKTYEHVTPRRSGRASGHSLETYIKPEPQAPGRASGHSLGTYIKQETKAPGRASAHSLETYIKQEAKVPGPAISTVTPVRKRKKPIEISPSLLKDVPELEEILPSEKLAKISPKSVSNSGAVSTAPARQEGTNDLNGSRQSRLKPPQSRALLFNSPSIEINNQSIVYEETVQADEKGDNSSVKVTGDSLRPPSQASVFIPPAVTDSSTTSAIPLLSPAPDANQLLYYNALVPGISHPVLIAIPASSLTIQASGDGLTTTTVPSGSTLHLPGPVTDVKPQLKD